MTLALSFPGEPRIVRSLFVNRFAVKIGKPGLDVPRRNEHGNAFAEFRSIDAISVASRVQLLLSLIYTETVPVHHHDQFVTGGSKTVGSQLLRKPSPDKLFRGAPSGGRLLHAHRAGWPSRRREKPPDERRVLIVLAQENRSYAPAQSSHPRATISESLSPESFWEATTSLSGRTETGPPFSRLSRNAESVPK